MKLPTVTNWASIRTLVCAIIVVLASVLFCSAVCWSVCQATSHRNGCSIHGWRQCRKPLSAIEHVGLYVLILYKCSLSVSSFTFAQVLKLASEAAAGVAHLHTEKVAG